MNRQLKILFYTIVLALAFLNKCGPTLRSTFSVPVERRSAAPKVSPSTVKPKESTSTSDAIRESQSDYEDLLKKIDELEQYTPIDISNIKSPESDYKYPVIAMAILLTMKSMAKEFIIKPKMQSRLLFQKGVTLFFY